jgi:tetratricopeptide (TPR) repeat protein
MPRFHFAQLGKPILGLLIALAAAAAMALPSPKDIDAAVSAGHLSQAETMLREVIQEKPNSAKAQYELGQVLARQARYADAQAALAQAKAIDPTLKFAASPEKFNDVFNKISQQAKGLTGNQVASALSEPRSAAVSPAPAAPEPSFPLHYVWMGIAGLVVLALVLRRQKQATPAYHAPMQATGPANTSPYAAGQPAAAGYGPGYAPGYPGGQPMGGGMGSGIGGAVVGGLAGVAAGYALSKALEGDHHSNAAPQSASGNSGYVPFENPAQPDVGSFDSGSGSGWDDAPSNLEEDDSW